jgi:antitoxin ParD1/3/4
MKREPELTSMNVSLPRSQRDFVEERVNSGGFGSTSDYIRELIRQDQRELARAELERKLVKAMDSKNRTNMTASFWKRLRRDVAERAKPARRGRGG